MSIPRVSEMPQIVYHPGDQDEIPITAENAMVLNDVKLSQNQQLRICRRGVEEVDRTFQSAREWQEVVVDADLAEELNLDSSYIGETISVSVDKEDRIIPFGDIKPNNLDGIEYGPGESSSSTNDTDLICPTDAFVTDNAQEIYNDLPGKLGGPVMNEDNYLTYSGAGIEVPGDLETDEESSSSS